MSRQTGNCRVSVKWSFYPSLSVVQIRIATRVVATLLSCLLLLLLLSLSSLSSTPYSQSRTYKYERLLMAPPSEVHLHKKHQKERPTTMLLAIFTRSSAYMDRKEYVRDTYIKGTLDEDDRFCKLDDFIRQTKEMAIEDRPCQVPYTFVIGAGGRHKPYDHDDDNTPITLQTDREGSIDPEGDCTYLNIQENMNFGKSPTYFKYGAELSKEYAIDYIAKLDDDTMISIDLLMEFINDELPPAPYNKRIYGGAARLSLMQSHMYAAGEFYFMSSDLADYVANSLTAEERSELMIRRRIEDLDMATFIYSHPMPIKFMNLYPRMFWHHPCKSEKCFRTFWEHQMPSLGNIERPVLPWTHYCQTILSGRQY